MPKFERRLVAAIAVTAALVAGALAGGFASPAAAQTSGKSQEQLDAEAAQLRQQQIDVQAQLNVIQQQRATVEAQIAVLTSQVNAAEAKLAPLAAEAARIDGVVADLQAQIEVSQRELDAAKAQLNTSAAGLYKSARGGSSTPLGFSGSLDQYVRGQKYLKLVSTQENDLVARVTGLRDDLDVQKQALHDAQVKADKERDAAQAARDQIAALRAQLQPARDAAAKQEAAEKAQLADIEERYGEVAAESASLRGAQDSIAALLRGKPLPGKPGGCDFRPVPFAINNGFGGASGHPGVDMAGPQGTPIRACRAGTVVIASWQGGYGNAVVIDHGGNMATLYGHQSQIAVQEGQHVDAGQVIGYVGTTGYSTGPHLHFEVRLSGNVVDPTPYLE
jgi:murein DD-endopeptidase MepM/ murein hydrolase activator NlpD